MYSIQQSINFSQPFIEYFPLSFGTNGEPAVSIANEIQNTVMNPPFTWGWNRNDNTNAEVPLNLQQGVQDYVVDLTDFGFLEKVSLTDPSNGQVWEILNVFNTLSLGLSDPTANKQGRPQSVCVYSVIYGTSVKLRFTGVPDKAYGVTLIYQKLPVPITSVNSNWGIPDQYIDIYNNLFLGEALANMDDARANIYRQRGITTLLAKAEGLTEMQKNMFLEMYWSRDRQQLAATLRAQQAQQARGV